MYRSILIAISILFSFSLSSAFARTIYKNVETPAFSSPQEAKKAAIEMAVKVNQGDFFRPTSSKGCRTKGESKVSRIQIAEFLDQSSKTLDSQYVARIYFTGKCR